MACTIDHLRIDHHVKALRAFTDLAGTRVGAGDTGVIRGLGLDTARMEIWIELERAGDRQRLRFALRATDGPRNGRMRDYFELGEAVDGMPVDDRGSAAVPGPPTAHDAEDAGAHDQAARRALAGHACDGASLGDLRVDCACDPAFHREVLPARSELYVHACLRCGALTCTRSVGDDGRFTGDAWQENLVVTLPASVRDWIAGWPRVRQDHAAHHRWPTGADYVRYPTLCYPADARCATLADLAALEQRLAVAQTGQSLAARLRASHRIHAAPPAQLPQELDGYRLLWQALQLRPDSDLAGLLYLAQPRSAGREIAAALVRERPDAVDVAIDCLRSSDPTRLGTGFMIARDLRPADPRLAAELIGQLGALSLDKVPDEPMCIAGRGRGELLLLTIADLGLDTPEMLAALRTHMRRLARHDAFLVDCIRTVLAELTATPGNPCAAPARSGARLP